MLEARSFTELWESENVSNQLTIEAKEGPVKEETSPSITGGNGKLSRLGNRAVGRAKAKDALASAYSPKTAAGPWLIREVVLYPASLPGAWQARNCL